MRNSIMYVCEHMHACVHGGWGGSVLHVIHSTGGYLYNSESHSILSNSLWPHGLTIQSMEFSRPEYCSRLPFPSPEDFPNPGIEPRSPTLQADSLQPVPPGKPIYTIFLQELFGQGVWVVLISITSLTSTAVSYLQTAGGHLFAYFSQCYQTLESVPISECKKWNWKIVVCICCLKLRIFSNFMSPLHFLILSLIATCGHSSYTTKINPFSGMLLAKCSSHLIFWLYTKTQISVWQKHYKQSD